MNFARVRIRLGRIGTLARASSFRRCSAIVAVGVSSVAEGSARKRSSAARDLPEAGGPVIKREVASSQYPVAGRPNGAGAYWLLAARYWLLLIMAWGLIAAWDLLEAGGLVIKKEVASSQYPVVRTAQ